MDIEKLNKSQIILLTLLTSFVTSIATGIVTVSLMEQAPPAITQTINRVVERTVEKVVPAAQTASVETKTIIIKESELIAEALEHVRPSVVRLYTSGNTPEFLGLGIITGKATIVSDSSALGEVAEMVMEMSGGQKVRAFVTRRGGGFAFINAATSSIDGKDLTWNSAAFAKSPVALGQTIFTISGKNTYRVGDGIITALEEQESGALIIDTNISGSSIMPGSPLIDTDGNVVAISIGGARTVSSAAFMPVSAITEEQKEAPKKDTP